MIEVLRTNDAVRLDYALVLLNRAGCHPFLADRFMSAAEGSISVFQRRVLVPDEFAARAKEVLRELDSGGSSDGAPGAGESDPGAE